MYGKEQNTKGAGGKKDRHTKERERERDRNGSYGASGCVDTKKKKVKSREKLHRILA